LDLSIFWLFIATFLCGRQFAVGDNFLRDNFSRDNLKTAIFCATIFCATIFRATLYPGTVYKGLKIDQMAIKCTNIVHYKTLENLPSIPSGNPGLQETKDHSNLLQTNYCYLRQIFTKIKKLKYVPIWKYWCFIQTWFVYSDVWSRWVSVHS
jgi:hypothetical protein